jgi:uncharacterized lipoprotein YddW (UPF0748 family)
MTTKGSKKNQSGSFLVVAAIAWAVCQSVYQCGAELRGIWVDAYGPGLFNAEQVKKLVEDCRKYNFNAVFVQVRQRGDALYLPQGTNQEPRNILVAPEFDALAEVIKECRSGKQRIEVHCWIVSHLIWSQDTPPTQPDHVYNRHRDWLTRDSAGKTKVGEGYYLDPGHPQANAWIRNIAKDLVRRYDIDGLHWDYCRYPGRDSGYNRTAIKRFNEETDSMGTPAPDNSKFGEWRRRQLTDFMRISTAELLQIKPQLVISAAVFASASDSYHHRFADWVSWCKEGIIDVAVPMNFSADTYGVFAPRAEHALANQGKRRIFMGQGAYMNSADNTFKQMNLVRKMGFAGTVLYSYRQLLMPKRAEAKADANVEQMIIVDDAAAVRAGDWQQGQYGKYQGNGYAFSRSGNGSNSLTFRLNPADAGYYDVYEWHVAGENRASDTPFIISHRAGTNIVRVNQKLDGTKWNYLGRFELTSNEAHGVTISDATSNAEEVVIADAIGFVPAPDNASPGGDQKAIDRIQSLDTAPDVFLAAFKKEFQPRWKKAPALPWKANPKRGIVMGKVLYSDTGKPADNALVTLNGATVQSQNSEPLGGYAFFEVPKGKYTITATAKDFGVVTNKVEVKAGAVIEVSLSLQR